MHSSHLHTTDAIKLPHALETSGLTALFNQHVIPIPAISGRATVIWSMAMQTCMCARTHNSGLPQALPRFTPGMSQAGLFPAPHLLSHPLRIPSESSRKSERVRKRRCRGKWRETDGFRARKLSDVWLYYSASGAEKQPPRPLPLLWLTETRAPNLGPTPPPTMANSKPRMPHPPKVVLWRQIKVRYAYYTNLHSAKFTQPIFPRGGNDRE